MALTNEETPKNEENAPPESPKSQKDGWDRSDIVAKWVSAVGTPLVIGVGSWLIQKSISEQSAQIQKSIAEQSLAKDYVGFAINIVDRFF
ncbi:MAG: hypothetical protein JO333_13070 [Verrucomicrobia bacterium]|nr:hypothetical protein [Verrucomicrobiota bacterium]